MRYLSKIFFFRHHYLLSKEDEKYFINKEDIVYCKGNKGDLYFVNTEAWHCGRPLSASGKEKFYGTTSIQIVYFRGSNTLLRVNFKNLEFNYFDVKKETIKSCKTDFSYT